MKKIEEFLSRDLERFGGCKPCFKDFLLKNECWYIWKFIQHMRYVEYHQNKGGLHKIAYYWHYYWFKQLQFKLHFAIYPNTIAPGFRIYHVGGYTHVGANVKIGKNCTMISGVVFGNKTEQEDNRPVVVGDDCYFGIDCKILGPVRIGNNVTVGAGAVITKDIPDNVVVGGIPAKILKYK